MGDSANSADSETKLIPVDVALLSDSDQANSQVPGDVDAETTLHQVPSELLRASTAPPSVEPGAQAVSSIRPSPRAREGTQDPADVGAESGAAPLPVSLVEGTDEPAPSIWRASDEIVSAIRKQRSSAPPRDAASTRPAARHDGPADSAPPAGSSRPGSVPDVDDQAATLLRNMPKPAAQPGPVSSRPVMVTPKTPAPLLANRIDRAALPRSEPPPPAHALWVPERPVFVVAASFVASFATTTAAIVAVWAVLHWM